MTLSMVELSRSTFEPLLNAHFVLQAGQLALDIDLIEVTSLGAPRAAAREPFSLVFRGPSTHALKQGTYPLTHPELGTQEIFLVPIARDKTHVKYEAIFT